MKSYCTQNDGDCYTCSLVNYNRDCQNNPIHGGKREGAGRPVTGRKQRKLQATDEEWAQITLQSKQAGYATVSEYIRAKLLENK